MSRNPRLYLLGMPLAGNRLERVRSSNLLAHLVSAALGSGIEVIVQVLALLIAALACLLQSDRRIDAKG